MAFNINSPRVPKKQQRLSKENLELCLACGCFLLELSKLILFEFFWKLQEVLLFQCLAVSLILLALDYDLLALSQCHKHLCPTKNHAAILIPKFIIGKWIFT